MAFISSAAVESCGSHLDVFTTEKKYINAQGVGGMWSGMIADYSFL
jgi:hypothetical protein